MKRASPVDLRSSLQMSRDLADSGVLFVPVPVTSREEYARLMLQAVAALDKIIEEAEASDGRA